MADPGGKKFGYGRAVTVTLWLESAVGLIIFDCVIVPGLTILLNHDKVYYLNDYSLYRDDQNHWSALTSSFSLRWQR